MNRRDFLKIGAITAVAAPNIVLGKSLLSNEKSLNLYNTNTGEFFKEVYWQQGQYNLEALVKLSKFMRDHRQNEVFAMDIDLIDYINEVQSIYDTKKPLLVNSGYRSKKTNLYLKNILGYKVAENSFHPKGQAVDISPDLKSRVSLRHLKNKSVSTKNGGVGYYPSQGFLHLDTGRVRYWHS